MRLPARTLTKGFTLTLSCVPLLCARALHMHKALATTSILTVEAPLLLQVQVLIMNPTRELAVQTQKVG